MKKLNKLIEGAVRYNEKLSTHTTFRIGGVVSEWVEPKDRNDLNRVIKIAKASKRPVYVIGGGSNLLINDRKIKGMVIRLANPSFRYIKLKKNASLIVGAGTSLNALVRFSIQNNLSGLEFCSKVPGTVGGAVVMNAGLGPQKPTSSVGNFIKRVTVIDKQGQVKKLNKKRLNFGYRSSSIGKDIVLEVEFLLKKAKKSYIRKLCREAVERKTRTQHLTKPSAGCIFKNPYKGLISAGKLLELAGLKEKRVGGAQVSKKHANYIINTGKAKFKDVTTLIDIMRRRISQKFNIKLELEVKIWE